MLHWCGLRGGSLFHATTTRTRLHQATLPDRLKNLWRYLGAEEMVGVRRLEDGVALVDGADLLVEDVEAAAVAELEGLVHGEGVGPRELRVEEVARDVQVLVARPQRDHVHLLTAITHIHTNMLVQRKTRKNKFHLCV